MMGQEGSFGWGGVGRLATTTNGASCFIIFYTLSLGCAAFCGST